METGERRPGTQALAGAGRAARRVAGNTRDHLVTVFGGPARSRVIVVLAAVLALSSADASTVGASATYLRQSLHIGNTDIGLLVAASSLVAAVASLPFGILADRGRRTTLLGLSISLWGLAMLWSATTRTFGGLFTTRLVLGVVTASAGPMVASLVGDLFAPGERGRVYSWILTGELLGAGVGFAVTGDIAALSWRAAFVILALPAFVLAWQVMRLPEPARGGASHLPEGAAELPRMSWRERRRSRHETEEPPPPPPKETDAQLLARDRGIDPAWEKVLADGGKRMGPLRAVRYVLRVRTNVSLIAAGACGYYFLAGVQTFGVEFVRDQYSLDAALANLLMLVVGAGAVGGVLAGGNLGDRWLRRGHLNSRITTAAVAAALTVVLFVPALLTRGVVTAVPYVTAAAFFLSAQNPPIDAARLDIMPPLLWGRAEGVRTLLRTGAQALAPLLFGVVSDHLFGGGRRGLQGTFIIMLVPLTASAVLLFRARSFYPQDVATAAASAQSPHPPGQVSEEWENTPTDPFGRALPPASTDSHHLPIEGWRRGEEPPV